MWRDQMKKLLIAADHAGLELKEHLKQATPEFPWEDLGTHSAESVDYPDFAQKLAIKVAPPEVIGVLICGSGQGMAIGANRFNHVRAALCWNEDMARLAREHNDANVLCLGSRYLDNSTAEKILLTFLDTPFAGGRHQRRVDKLWSPS